MTPSKPSAVSPYFPLSRRKTARLLKVAPPGLPEDCEDCYAPTFAKLYSHLELLKPALIQGTTTGAHPSTFNPPCRARRRRPVETAHCSDPTQQNSWEISDSLFLGNSFQVANPLGIISRCHSPHNQISGGFIPRWIANESDLTATIRHLGTSTVRAKRLIDLSRTYLQDPPSHSDPRPSRATIPHPVSFRKYTKYPPTPVSHLPGTGPYALDSYRIFCTVNNDFTSEEWMTVMPSDKELIKYLVRTFVDPPNPVPTVELCRSGSGPPSNIKNGSQDLVLSDQQISRTSRTSSRSSQLGMCKMYTLHRRYNLDK